VFAVALVGNLVRKNMSTFGERWRYTKKNAWVFLGVTFILDVKSRRVSYIGLAGKGLYLQYHLSVSIQNTSLINLTDQPVNILTAITPAEPVLRTK
jgi:hypothetical protein